MKIDLYRTDGAILLYALQLLLDFQEANGYSYQDKEETRRISQIVFDATLQGE